MEVSIDSAYNCFQPITSCSCLMNMHCRVAGYIHSLWVSKASTLETVSRHAKGLFNSWTSGLTFRSRKSEAKVLGPSLLILIYYVCQAVARLLLGIFFTYVCCRGISGSEPPRDIIPTATPMFSGGKCFNGAHATFPMCTVLLETGKSTPGPGTVMELRQGA